MFTTTELQRALIAFAVITSFGVLVHDTKLDQAAAVALAIPLGMTLGMAAHAPELRSEGHTHIERAAFEKTLQQNNIPVRNDHRRYMLAKHARGFNMPEPHMLVVDPETAPAL